MAISGIGRSSSAAGRADGYVKVYAERDALDKVPINLTRKC